MLVCAPLFKMDTDDILDSMSLSDDELLDSLADDMLEEMETTAADDDEEVLEEIHTVAPTTTTATTRSSDRAPDLGRMMAQMMPMMSQMFGGGARGPPSSAIRGPQLSWDDVVRQYVPAGEQSEWLETIRHDELRQRTAAMTRPSPPSRAYRTSAQPLPSAYLQTETLAASLLDEAVRAAQCEQSPTWRRDHDRLGSQLVRSGLADVFAREFKRQLRERVVNDPDYVAQTQAADGSGRFANIAKALAV